MLLAAQILTGLVLLIHIYIFLLETVLFRTRGMKVFGFPRDSADMYAPLMSNQGCYNGFLAAALALGLLHPDPAIASAFVWFGLGCVAIAGVWGAVTAKVRILFVQTVPAALAMGAWLLAG